LRRRWLRVIGFALFHVLVAVMLLLYVDEDAVPVVRHWMRETAGSLLGLFRAAGRWPGAVLGAILLWRLKKRGGRWALAMILAAVAMAILAEGIARSVCRWRPKESGGPIRFSTPFSRFANRRIHGASFPSGDASVAFAVATVLAAAAPRGRLVFYALAVGSAYWRMGTMSHYLSDCYVSAVLGWAVASVCLLLFRLRPRPGPGPAGPEESHGHL
jgi:membrane-associated phospholipid phosphatase